MFKRKPAAILAAFALVLAGASTLPAAAPAEGSEDNPYAWFDPLIDVHHLIMERYVEKPDAEAMQRAAVEGMIDALHDPYTEYIPPTQQDEFDKALRGRYIGIGASVRMEDGVPTVVSPLQDSPAFEAGLMAGDRIVAIDGVSTEGLTLPETVEQLSGEPGEPVVVTVERDDETKDIRIVREKIVTSSLAGWRRVGDNWDHIIDPQRGIGYIRLSRFSSETPKKLRQTIESLLEDDMNALALDLRDNPGGLLAAAIQTADLFLEGGLIVSTKGRAHEEQTVYASAEETLPDFPLVVLLNGRSASASEVVAGALRDNDRAKVVGSRSFGKGAVQNIVALPSGGGQLKITEQHYYGPSGRKIHREDDSTEWGVDPSPGFFVPMSDEQASEMLEVQHDLSVIRESGSTPDISPDDPGWIEDELKDKQLAAAVEALRLRLKNDEWIATGRENVEQGVQQAELRRLRETRDRMRRNLERVERRIEAMRSVADADETTGPAAMIPDDADLTGGRVELYNAQGDVIAKLRITNEGVRRWLSEAPLEKTPNGTNSGEKSKSEPEP